MTGGLSGGRSSHVPRLMFMNGCRGTYPEAGPTTAVRKYLLISSFNGEDLANSFGGLPMMVVVVWDQENNLFWIRVV